MSLSMKTNHGSESGACPVCRYPLALPSAETKVVRCPECGSRSRWKPISRESVSCTWHASGRPWIWICVLTCMLVGAELQRQAGVRFGRYAKTMELVTGHLSEAHASGARRGLRAQEASELGFGLPSGC